MKSKLQKIAIMTTLIIGFSSTPGYSQSNQKELQLFSLGAKFVNNSSELSPIYNDLRKTSSGHDQVDYVISRLQLFQSELKILIFGIVTAGKIMPESKPEYYEFLFRMFSDMKEGTALQYKIVSWRQSMIKDPNQLQNIDKAKAIMKKCEGLIDEAMPILKKLYSKP